MTEAVFLQCNNKGCYEKDYHKLDVTTDAVMCIRCGGVVSNISSYMKRTLRDLKQIFSKPRQAAELKCKACEYTDAPVLLDYGQDRMDVACVKCLTPDVHLSRYFVAAMKLNENIRRIKAVAPVKKESPPPKVSPDAEKVAVEPQGKATGKKKKEAAKKGGRGTPAQTKRVPKSGDQILRESGVLGTKLGTSPTKSPPAQEKPTVVSSTEII